MDIVANLAMAHGFFSIGGGLVEVISNAVGGGGRSNAAVEGPRSNAVVPRTTAQSQNKITLRRTKISREGDKEIHELELQFRNYEEMMEGVGLLKKKYGVSFAIEG